MRYYSVYDKLTDSYSNLLASPSDRALYRTLRDNLKDEHPWRKNPEDYALCSVIELDDSCISLVCAKPVVILSSLLMIFEKEVSNG